MRSKERLCRCSISFILCMCVFASGVFSDAEYVTAEDTAPQGCGMSRHDRRFEAQIEEAFSDGEGYIPMPGEERQTGARDIKGAQDEPTMSARSMESSYNTDFDTIKQVYPATRHQNYNDCWAFTTTAMAEFSGIKSGSEDSNVDYSELALAYFTNRMPADPLGGTSGDEVIPASDGAFLLGGGNMELAIRTLSRWNGILWEKSVPQAKAKEVWDYGLSDHHAYDENAAILRGGYYLNVRDAADRSTVKTAVKAYGAVGLGFGAYRCFYDERTNTYYNPYSYRKQDMDYNAAYISNHAVVIVGWDDTKEVAGTAKRGAWLVRNSWSKKTTQSYESYFWLSYYDRSICTRGFAVEMTPADAYDNNYQYDGSVFCEPRVRTQGDGTYYDPVRRGANVFTASGDELLRSISISTEDTNAAYTVEIYTGDSLTHDPCSGRRVALVSGVTAYAGLSTIDLPTPVALKKGEDFSVVVSLPRAKRGISLEYGYDFGSMKVRVDIPKDSSYLYQDGWWYDMSDADDMGPAWKDDDSGEGYGNLCIKAYTRDAGRTPTIDKPVSLTQNEASRNSISLRWKKQSGVDGYYIYRRSSANGIYSSPVAEVAANKNVCRIGGLAASKKYYYVMQSYSVSDSGRIIRSEISNTAVCVTAPEKVKGLKASGSRKTSVTLKWKRCSGADGYYVYRRTGKNGRIKCIARIKKGSRTSYTSKKLKRGRKYYYFVRAYRSNGKRIYKGASSSIIKRRT